jgi:dipeptidase E
MRLYISSYKLGDKTGVLREWMGKIDNKIALIPNALDPYPDGERKKRGIASDLNALEELGFSATVISLKQYFGKEEQLRSDLSAFRAFFAIGGNTFVLRQAMKLSGFDKYLKALSSSDSHLYGGYSAGICLLAPSMRGLELVDDPAADPYNCKTSYEGLGLIDYLPVPHYRSDHPESPAMEDVVKYLNEKGVNYVTLRDGDVIIEDTRAPK